MFCLFIYIVFIIFFFEIAFLIVLYIYLSYLIFILVIFRLYNLMCIYSEFILGKICKILRGKYLVLFNLYFITFDFLPLTVVLYW